MTQQPVWKFVANLGDVNLLDYGGLFVYVDTTGVYPPEAVKLIASEDDFSATVEYRFVLENLTLETITSEWFYSSLPEIASYIGSTTDALIASLLSSDPSIRARAWEAIGSYHGFLNLDQYPTEYVGEAGRLELEARFAEENKRLTRT
jgi:hypothetical protein